MIKTPTTTTLLSEETELFLENLSQITNQVSDLTTPTATKKLFPNHSYISLDIR